MGLLSLFGLGAPSVSSVEAGAVVLIEAINGAGEKVFTSTEEKSQWTALMEKAKKSPAMIQAVITASEATSGSKFSAWARPALIWVLVFSLGYSVVLRDLVIMAFHVAPADIPASPLSVNMIMSVLGQLMGIGG